MRKEGGWGALWKWRPRSEGRAPLKNDYFLLPFPCLSFCVPFAFLSVPFPGGHGEQMLDF